MPVQAHVEEVGSRRRRCGPTARCVRGWIRGEHGRAPAAGHLRRPAGRPGERGAVTAETVMVLPVLVAVALGLVWALALATTQVRVVDAAREAARAAARDETRAGATDLGRRVAPGGSTVTVRESGGTVVARVQTQVRGPGGLLRILPPVSVHAEAVAAREQQ